MVSDSRGKTRTIVLQVVAVLSVLTQAALFGIVITLAIIELPVERLRSFVLASSALNGLLVLALLAVIATILSDSRSATTLETFLFTLSFSLSISAIALSFYVLISIWTTYHFKPSNLNTSITACLVVTGLTLCSLTIITQTLTHLLVLFQPHPLPPRAVDTQTTSEQQSVSTPSPKRFSVNLRALTTPTSPSRAQFSPYSPSLNSLHSLKSSRQGSMTHVFGPLGSKTRLLITHPLHLSDSQSQLSKREPSLEIACRGEVAEIIETPEPYELSSSPPPRMNLTRTMLETIPGSRPVSPAKPLDGPYLFDEITPEDFPLPDSPSLSRATSPIYACGSSPSTEHHLHGLPFPPMIGEFASSSQTHIHPLFRSDSPGPPPATTPGTMVIASPYAGQVVGSDHALAKKLKSSHGSRPPTPARSPVPSVERMENVPNFSRPGALSRTGSRSAEMF